MSGCKQVQKKLPRKRGQHLENKYDGYVLVWLIIETEYQVFAGIVVFH